MVQDSLKGRSRRTDKVIMQNKLPSTMDNIIITQAMGDSVRGEAIEQAYCDSQIKGLVFFEMFGGLYAIHHPERNETLKKRFQGLDVARNFAIARLCNAK